MRALTVFAQLVCTLAIVVMALASGLLLIAHRGPSLELAKALAVLALFVGLLLITERWWRWSRR
ncbi:hypothetical protein [Streptomyces lydicus]|uniref:hypothetical protein n=1 Tax=Streptomyces lydicus TaxID=47763 RepID=UPI001011B055|nr:hypothetical protein [Streptomyces lydicus]MCZ1012290.1 hypothetical protein [Streptomyces lydicus]